MINKLTNLFYKSFLGAWYLEVLIFIDKLKGNKVKLTPGEISQIVREYSQLAEGVKTIKNRVNNLITARNKEEYDKVLREVEDLVLQAGYDKNHPKFKIINSLREKMDLSNKDIKNDTDYAKMIEKRIADYKELHQHIEKRKALREARKANNGRRN